MSLSPILPDVACRFWGWAWLHASMLVLMLPSLALGADEAFHDHVVIVLDASGSMNGTLAGTRLNKMAAAKDALKQVLRTVPASTHIGLLVFSARNLANDWLYPLGPRQDDVLMRAIDLPQPGQGTPLGRYIKKGADRLLEERAKTFGYGTYRLLVVTDGEAGDPNLVERHVPDVLARGITVDVIGVGMDRRHTLATRVHSYRAANDPAALKEALVAVFAEISAATTDVAQGDAFEQIAPLPSELALAIVRSLATTGNEPIGERRPVTASAPARPGATPAAAPPPPVRTASKPTWARVLVGLALACVFGMILLLGLLALVLKMAKRSRR